MVKSTVPLLVRELDTGADLDVLITHILDNDQNGRLATLDTTFDIHQAGTVLDIDNGGLGLFSTGSWSSCL